MLRTLRSRLVLSHILPLLIIIPIAGLLLVYVLETRVVLVNLTTQMRGQAVLVGEIAQETPSVWTDPVQARRFVERVAPLFPAQLMLLDSDGTVLATSDPTDLHLVGGPMQLPGGVERALNGEEATLVNYSQNLHADIADVMVPQRAPDESVVGVIRLTHQLVSVSTRFQRLRFLILEVLGASLILGAAMGWIFAHTLQRPISRVTDSIQESSSGRLLAVSEEGPEEVQLLARAYNTLTERLRALEAARRHLLANLVHELGRPLGALSAAGHALSHLDEKEHALRDELISGMNGEIQRLSRLLDSLTELYDSVLGGLELDRHALPITEWLPPLLAPWRQQARAKAIDWQVTLPETLPPVLADPDRLAQVVGNLLSNAIRYSRPGDTIEIDVGVTGANLWIRISDTGIGIAPEEQTRIFDAFYRSHATTRFPQGMGLGLTIARDIVVAHGGRLDVKSAPGEGSVFTLWLPLAPSQPAASALIPATS